MLQISTRNRISLRMICCLTAVCIFFSLTPAYAELGSAEIQEIVLSRAEEVMSCPPDGLVLEYLTFNEETGAWHFEVSWKIRPEDMRSGFSGDVDPEGHFLHVSEPRWEHPAENLNREYKLTPHTHDALYRLREKWLPLLQSLSEEDNAYLADPNNTYLVPVRDLMLQELVLPDETFLSREEAESAAIRAIEAVDGWKKELTAHIGLDLDVTHIPAGSGRPVWDLVNDLAGDAEFHRLCRSGAAVSDREFDRLDRQSDQDREAFGGSAPLYIFVRIDARTGELIGDVHFEMAPSDRRMEELLIMP